MPDRIESGRVGYITDVQWRGLHYFAVNTACGLRPVCRCNWNGCDGARNDRAGSKADHAGAVIKEAKSCSRASLRGREEIVVGGVTALGFGGFVRFVAAIGWRLAAVGVDALDSGDVRQQAFAGMAHDRHQQPWDRIRIERVHARGAFARYLAAVFQLPCRTSRVLADDLILAVVKFGVGSLKSPCELAVGASRAGINL